ncbi:MAG: high-affinity iron transporter [Glaciecola sp.]|jgi:high-affinity iron transporter
MLINSLLLFIEETLAIFILYSYISAWHFLDKPEVTLKLLNKQLSNKENPITKAYKLGHHASYTLAIIIGILFSAVFTQFRPSLGMLFDGVGYEVFLILTTCVFVASVLLAFGKRRFIRPQLCFAFSLFLIVIPHASDFIVFLSSVTQSNMHASVYAGISVGLGICFSISYLLYFLFLNVNKVLPYQLAVSLFLSAQLSNIVVILQQIDVLSSSLPLWNTNYFVEDKSEFGQFFHVLFGYDATPTLLYLLALTFFTFIILGLLVKSPYGRQTARGVAQ